jgi:hypothetical protein
VSNFICSSCVNSERKRRSKGEKFRNTLLLYIFRSDIALQVSKTFRNTEYYIGNSHERNHVYTCKENRIMSVTNELLEVPPYYWIVTPNSPAEI